MHKKSKWCSATRTTGRKETDAHYEGMNWLYEAFHAANPDITIENILNPDSEESRQENPGRLRRRRLPGHHPRRERDMWDAGYLLDLTPYLDADPAWKALLDPNVLGTTTTDGKIWALSGEVSPLPTIWNTRILEEAGVTAVPATWDELLAACEAIKAAGKLPDLLGSRRSPPVAQHPRQPGGRPGRGRGERVRFAAASWRRSAG